MEDVFNFKLSVSRSLEPVCRPSVHAFTCPCIFPPVLNEVEGKEGNGMKWNGMEWSGVERNKAEWNARGQNGMGSSGREGNGTQSP